MRLLIRKLKKFRLRFLIVRIIRDRYFSNYDGILRVRSFRYCGVRFAFEKLPKLTPPKRSCHGKSASHRNVVVLKRQLPRAPMYTFSFTETVTRAPGKIFIKAGIPLVYICSCVGIRAILYCVMILYNA